MEDIYHLHRDCIQSMLDFEYMKFQYCVNLKLIHRSFYTERNFISSLCINSSIYSDALDKLRILKNKNNITSLKIKCNNFSNNVARQNDLWNQITNLCKLTINIDFLQSTENKHADYSMRDHETFTKLTYLKIKCANGTMDFDPKSSTNLMYLKLKNIFLYSPVDYFKKLTNLISLNRNFPDETPVNLQLYYKYHSNLIHLKLNNMRELSLHGMTQLKTQILRNIERVIRLEDK